MKQPEKGEQNGGREQKTKEKSEEVGVTRGHGLG